MIRRTLGLLALTALGGAVGPTAAAQATTSAQRSAAAWTPVAEHPARRVAPRLPVVAPDRFAAFRLDHEVLHDVLDGAPTERRQRRGGARLVVSVPTPTGDLARFAIVQTPVLDPATAAAQPEIRTFAGRGLDDPTSTVRLDLTPLGFHAAVRTSQGSWYVDPRFRDRSQYVSYARDALDPAEGDALFEPPGARRDDRPTDPAPAARAGGDPVALRTYRLALVSDPTYATAVGGAANVTAAKATLIHRVNQLYEAQQAIRLVLVGGTATNLDTTAAAQQGAGPCGPTACFTPIQLGSCENATLPAIRTALGALVGASGYDVGHLVLGRNGGGLAGLGVVGRDRKAEGCTGLVRPVGDVFAVDYVAHELGHQFAADHTFATASGDCGANREPDSGVEPGGGSTVMAYAGICGDDDLQAHSDPYFGQVSTDQIQAYVAGPPVPVTSVQRVVLTGFDGSDAFALGYAGQRSPTIVRGGTYTVGGVRDAIQAIPGWPAGATVTVGALNDTGFTVTFGGTLAGSAVGSLSVADPVGVSGSSVSELSAGGPSRQGGQQTATGNHAPSVTTAAGFTIPARTPFTLSATGSDVDGDPLTYRWEQNDRSGGGETLRAATRTDGPLFRVFGTAARYAHPDDAYLSPAPGQNRAAADPTRTFPDALQIAAGNTNAATGSCPAAGPDAEIDCLSERLPTVAWVGTGNRTLHFRVTAADDRPGGGGSSSAGTALRIDPTAGPFRISSQDVATTHRGNSVLAVTWDPAGTGVAPIGVSDVRISFSSDGGLSFPRVLTASTPNDGSASVVVPPGPTARGRIKVEAIGNVFFDVSRGDLTVTDPPLDAPEGLAAVPVDFGAARLGQAGIRRAVTVSNVGTGPVTTGGLTVVGPDAAAFRVEQDACTTTTIAAGGTCTVQVRLVPDRIGSFAATLRLVHDAPSSPLSVALSGSGLAAEPEPVPGSDPEGGAGPGPQDGSGPGAPAGDPGIIPFVPGRGTPGAPASCRVSGVQLVGITRAGSSGKPRVDVVGIAGVALRSRKVQLVQGSRVIASSRVAADGTITVGAAAPRARRARSAARYRLVVGDQRSASASTGERLRIVARRRVAGGLRVTGRVTGAPLRRALTVSADRGCAASGFERPRTVRTDRRGRFVVTLPAALGASTSIRTIGERGRREAPAAVVVAPGR